VDEYKEFLNSKKRKAQDSGFEISKQEINSKLFEFQKDIVKLAIKKGKFAIFAECGLGKTAMQLEWANQVHKKTGQPVLILAPLAVAGQTVKEGEKFNIPITHVFDNKDICSGINITNYEKLEKLDCSVFSGIVLDESSILKNYTGMYKQLIIETFKFTPYKLACTATPAPNDILELGNHCDFLNVMPSTEMIVRFFINDTMHAGGYRLKKHSVNDFYEWVCGWAVMFSNPNDLGYNEDGYNLPKLNIFEELVEVNEDNTENGTLLKTGNISATNFNAELRSCQDERLSKVAELVNGSTENWIVWVNQNAEADYLKKAIPDAVEVRGDEKEDHKEKKLLGFANDEFRVLITKKKIAQFGLNYQNCRNQVFSSVDFSFESTYQAIRRSYRFGQKKEVNIHLITTSTMNNVMDIIHRKESSFKELQNGVKTAMLKELNQEKRELKMSYKHEVKKSDMFEIHRGDCTQEIDRIEDNSIDFSIFSPPFSNLYTYSDQIEDMGNNENDNAFFVQFGFMVKKLYSKMRPGRLVAVHCKNLVNYKNRDGMSGMRDFRGDLIRLFTDIGFSYHCDITIWKDPVIEMQRTKNQGLLYKQLRADSTMSRVGMPEYLLLFRKWSKNETESAMEMPVNNKNYENFPVKTWQEWASPVWMTVNQTKVLNTSLAKHPNDEKHICPLQLDIIERAVYMWSNEGETVFSPFAGIGSEGYQSILCGRKFKGIELKESYFKQAINYCTHAENQKSQYLF